MSTTTLNSRHLVHTQPSAVGTALHELATAGRHLVVALWDAALQRQAFTAQPLTAFEEAENLRTLAETHLAADPVFAHELFAAADRHERAALVRA